MKLYLKKHTERYPVEQLQLQLFAQEPSEFCTEPFTGDGTVSSLSRGKRYLTATAKVTYQGKTGFAVNRVLLDRADVRATRRILQRSYYLAALQVLPAAPPWGALSGVRPTKLSTKCLMAGGSEKDAEKLLREVYFVSPERVRLCVDASRHTVEAAKLLDADDLSVYIGIPFCPTRCAYCSFVSQSIERFGEFLPAYLDALLREIAHTGALLKNSGFHIRTLYMGGGTPTTLSSTQMARLLDAINWNFDLSRCLEFTVEGGRPDTLDPEKLRVIKDGGATRISINPQTMSDKVLEAVGRRHTARQTVEAYEQAVQAGFDDINMDLIAGLPADDAASFAGSIRQVLDLNPSNITVHTLALKKGAALFGSRMELPPQEAVAAMLAGACAGFITAFLQTRLKIPSILAGIITNTGLYTVNLAVMGFSSNVSMVKADTMFSLVKPYLGSFYKLIPAAVLTVAVGILLTLFLKTRLGLSIRATGDNAAMVRASSINPAFTITVGLCISGALTALSGGLLAQYQKSSDINVGTGMVTIALASLIIGETLVGKRTMVRRVLGVVFGSCLYRFIVAVALRFNVPAAAMKLVSALIVAIAISMPAIQNRLAFEKRKHAAQKKEAV